MKFRNISTNRIRDFDSLWLRPYWKFILKSHKILKNTFVGAKVWPTFRKYSFMYSKLIFSFSFFHSSVLSPEFPPDLNILIASLLKAPQSSAPEIQHNTLTQLILLKLFKSYLENHWLREKSSTTHTQYYSCG